MRLHILWDCRYRRVQYGDVQVFDTSENVCKYWIENYLRLILMITVFGKKFEILKMLFCKLLKFV